VYLWHPEAGTLHPSEGIHVGPTEHRHLPLRPDQGVTGRAFSQRRVQLVNDYPNDFHARPNALDCQVRALIAAPLLTTDDVLGVISVSTHAPGHHFDQDDARLLELIAAQISGGLENIRLFDVVGQIEALRELDRLKTEFLSTVSHELRTPLSYIHGYAELLLARELTRAEVSEMAREIHRGSTSMVRLVDDLLDVSRIESGHFSLQVAPTRIEDLLRSLASVFRVQADHHSITLDLPDGLLPPVLVDSARARQVLSNLLSNAVQYSPGGGEIVVGARAERRHVRSRSAIRDRGSRAMSSSASGSVSTEGGTR
jgi:signal transduction histidine kinase